jgi:glycosyltransferase involved in cell wall biosynthesis
MMLEPSSGREGTAVPLGSPLQGCDVVFVLPHLGPGGAQRVATLVANQWIAQGLSVGLITTLDNKPDAHHLDPAVRRVRLSTLNNFGTETINSQLHRAKSSMSKAVSRIMMGLRTSATSHDLAAAINVPTRSLRFVGLRLMHLVIMLPLWSYNVSRSMLRKAVKFLLKTADLVAARIILPLITLRNPRSGTGKRYFRMECIPFVVWMARRLVGHRERSLRRLFESAPPPRVISFLTKTNILTALATWKLPTHLVISERNDPDLQQLEPVWEVLRRLSYRRANLATSNSTGVLQKMQRFCDSSQLAFLPNPVSLSHTINEPLACFPHFVIVARLVHQKAIDVLLAAFAKITSEVPEWRLIIIGDGPLREELGQLSEKLGVDERVTFKGHVATPVEFLCTSSVFVLPSRFEGMPNSLLEAMACGLPVIVSDASPGPLELVLDNRTGLVVPVEDSDALAAAMLRLAQDGDYRSRLGSEARSLVSRHDWSAVEITWREVLNLPMKQEEPARIAPMALDYNNEKQINI